MNIVDPSGMYAYHDEEDKIHIPVVWTGKGKPPDTVRKAVDQAKEKYAKQDISVDFYESRQAAEEAGLTEYNTMQRGNPGFGNRAQTDFNRNITLGDHANSGDVPHEIGHCMGLPDEYVVKNGVKELKQPSTTLGIEVNPSVRSVMYSGAGEVTSTHKKIGDAFIRSRGY